MRKSVIAILFIALLFSCEEKRKKVDEDKVRLEKVCDEFMTQFSLGQVTKAMDLLRTNSVISNSQIDSLTATANNHMSNAFTSYGKIIGFEFVSEKNISDFIYQRFYILKFEKFYLKFDFFLYNNGKRWAITGFNYSDDLGEMLY